MFTEEHLYAIALRQCRRIGDITYHKLIQEFGSAKEAWFQLKDSKTSLEGIGPKTTADIGNELHLKTAENELSYCEKKAIQILLSTDSNYPLLLRNCDDAPAHIFYKGKFPHQKKSLSIVGTRNITSYGKTFLNQFIAALPKNVATVSGLALGVDTEVHALSIDYEIPTIAVLAHGFESFYPPKNKDLANRILDSGGAIMTEFLSGQTPEREFFLQRNRIVAGLSHATIVVETAYGGGSISTATFANNYNRDVFALPGRITDKFSQGCNHLIFQNKAIAISNIKSLIEALNLETLKSKDVIPSLFPEDSLVEKLNKQEQGIYNSIKENNMISLDELAFETNMATYILLPILLQMELNGIVKSYSGRQFSLNNI